jgi:hypothetical protein
MTQTQPDPNAPVDTVDTGALQLENAMLRAGVDLDSKQGQILRDAWTGRDVDAAAIKEQWAILMPVETPPPTVETPATTDPPPAEGDPRIEGEAQQAAERQALATGATSTVVPPEIDVRTSSVEQANQVLQQGGTRADAMATGFHARAVAAGKGDTSVLVQNEPVIDE